MGCFSSPKTSVQQQSTMNPEQQKLLSGLIGMVQPNVGQPGPVFPGQRVADLSGLQQQGIDMAGGIPGMVGQAQGMGFGGIQDIMQGNDFFSPAQDAAQNFFQNTVTPEVMGTFAQSGSADSGLAQKALSNAGRDVSLGLADRLSGLQLQQQGNQLGALSQLPGFANMTGQGAGQLQSLGGLPQQQQQQQIGAQQQIFQEQQPLYSPYFSAAAQLAGMPAFENIGVQQGAGLGQTLLGGAMGAVGMGLSGGGGIKGLWGG